MFPTGDSSVVSWEELSHHHSVKDEFKMIREEKLSRNKERYDNSY